MHGMHTCLCVCLPVCACNKSLKQQQQKKTFYQRCVFTWSEGKLQESTAEKQEDTFSFLLEVSHLCEREHSLSFALSFVFFVLLKEMSLHTW